jgi:phosphoribosylpyrophosphate synthetase
LPAEVPGSVVLIDDVVTKGRTLLAAAATLHAANPATTVRGFALLRTMGYEAIDRLLEPCSGIIGWNHGDAQRVP